MLNIKLISEHFISTSKLDSSVYNTSKFVILQYFIIYEYCSTVLDQLGNATIGNTNKYKQDDKNQDW